MNTEKSMIVQLPIVVPLSSLSAGDTFTWTNGNFPLALWLKTAVPTGSSVWSINLDNGQGVEISPTDLVSHVPSKVVGV